MLEGRPPFSEHVVEFFSNLPEDLIVEGLILYKTATSQFHCPELRLPPICQLPGRRFLMLWRGILGCLQIIRGF